MFKKLGKIILAIPRWGARIIVLLLIVPLILGFFAIRQHQSIEPSVEDAPWAVQTYTYLEDGAKVRSRLYYGKEYSGVEGTPTLYGWYEWNGKRYVLHKDFKDFPKDEWGAVDVIRRKQ